MTALTLHRWMVAILVGAACCGSSMAQTVDTRCLADGGIALCSEPVIVPSSPGAAVDSEMWNYGLCDMDGAFAWRERAWCEASGGTWGANGCVGPKPIFDPDVAPVSTKFERILTNACSLDLADTGWGQTLPYSILCWYGAPVTRNGKLILDFRALSFSGLAPGQKGCDAPWKDVVRAGRWRAVSCPKGYNTRTKPSGDLECWRLPPQCSEKTKAGNPINLLDGCKLQREVDYQSRTPGGLVLERNYNSAGYFRFDAAPEQATDVWRTTWDRRILVPPVAGTVLGYAQRADGSLQVFLSDGRELHNVHGGASATLQRVADNAGVTTGWRLTTADKDVELYDAAGRVQSITLRTGHAYALAYDANGRLATVTDIHGNALAFAYDAAGRLAGFTAPGNRAYAYGYDSMRRLTTVTYPDNSVRTYHYENATFLHALTGITDENGQRYATWTYDSAGRATSSQHAGGAEAVALAFGAYSATANAGATRVTDAFGTGRGYDYQAIGGVLRVTRMTRPCPGCAGTSANYTYDANGNVSSYRDFNGNQTNYAYDLTRNLEVSRTEAYGTVLARATTTEWHPAYRLPTRVTAPSGVAGINEVTDLAYDAQGNLLRKAVTAGTGSRQWSFTYNALGQLLTHDGPRTDIADVTTYTYYASADPCVACRGNLKTVTNALGQVTTFDVYDTDGQPTRIIDPNGVVTALTYDLRGRVKTRTTHAGSPLAETTAFGYDGAGQLLRVTMPDGSFLRNQYDAAHRLTEVADSLGNVIQYTLDAMGNRIKEDVFDPADRLAKTQQRIYDVLNRLYNDIGAAGQLTAYGYDGNGNLKTSTDPLNRTTAQAYDALNRLLSSTDPAGAPTQYGYDAKDRLVSVRDPIGLVTTYTYDGLGNLTQLASPDTGVARYASDAAGNVVAATDARGVSTSYSYDALNRQKIASFAGGTVALEYDNTVSGGAYAKGRLTRVTDPSGSTSYVYDAWGRVVTKLQTMGDSASPRSLAVSYQHAAGRMTGITYPSERSVSYDFDAQGRIRGVTVGGQVILTGVTYQPFGAVQGWTWGNGQAYRRSYDTDGRITALTLGPDSAAYGNENWAFGYDNLNRLTAATLPQGEALAYTYDGNGNRKQETRGGAATGYSYVAASNRLKALSGAVAKNFTYDAAGNLTGNGSLTFTYDGRGRLTQLSSGYRYLINGMGQRVAKSGPAVATGIIYFVYDEQGRMLGEYDAAGGVRQELVYVADTPVASVRPAASGGVDIYPIYSDHLNTPRLITDQANRIVWEWKMDTFGAGPPNENPSGLGAFSFNLRFPGQYYDAESGLHYNYFRDYDPTIGGYVESDPIGLDGGRNTFAYVVANPIRYYDSFGLEGCGSGFFDPIIPNNPFGFQFKACCDIHDNCYDDCKDKTPKPMCDGEFCRCLSGKCNKYSGAVKWTCEKTAGQYCLKASNTETSMRAFDDSRKKCDGPLSCGPTNRAS